MVGGFLQFEVTAETNRRISNRTPFTYSVRFEQKTVLRKAGGHFYGSKSQTLSCWVGNRPYGWSVGLTRLTVIFEWIAAQVLSKAPVSIVVSAAAD